MVTAGGTETVKRRHDCALRCGQSNQEIDLGRVLERRCEFVGCYNCRVEWVKTSFAKTGLDVLGGEGASACTQIDVYEIVFHNGNPALLQRVPLLAEVLLHSAEYPHIEPLEDVVPMSKMRANLHCVLLRCCNHLGSDTRGMSVSNKGSLGPRPVIGLVGNKIEPVDRMLAICPPGLGYRNPDNLISVGRGSEMYKTHVVFRGFG